MADVPKPPAPPRSRLSAEVSAIETAKKEWWRKANFAIITSFFGGLALLVTLGAVFGGNSRSALVEPLFATALLMMCAGAIGSFFSAFKPRKARFDLGVKFVFILALMALLTAIYRMIS